MYNGFVLFCFGNIDYYSKHHAYNLFYMISSWFEESNIAGRINFGQVREYFNTSLAQLDRKINVFSWLQVGELSR